MSSHDDEHDAGLVIICTPSLTHRLAAKFAMTRSARVDLKVTRRARNDHTPIADHLTTATRKAIEVLSGRFVVATRLKANIHHPLGRHSYQTLIETDKNMFVDAESQPLLGSRLGFCRVGNRHGVVSTSRHDRHLDVCCDCRHLEFCEPRLSM